MPDSSRPTRMIRSTAARGGALVLIAAALLSTGCGYQVALQPTATPGGPLGVRQVASLGGNPTAIATIAEAAAVTGTAAAGVAVAVSSLPGVSPAATGGGSAPAATSSGGGGTGTAGTSVAAIAPAAVAVAAPTVSGGSVPSSGSSSPAQGAPPVAVNAAPTAEPSPATATARPSRPPFATPPASFTEAPVVRVTAIATAARPPASVTATAAAATGPVQVYLPQGSSQFRYVGPTQPADRALASLAGQYDMVTFAAPDGGNLIYYRPGVDPIAPLLAHNTLSTITMKRSTAFTMQPPR